MRSTLFYIPHQLGPLPVFGLGWLFVAMIAVYLSLVFFRRRSGFDWQTAISDILGWGLALAAIGFLAPRMETYFTLSDGTPYPVGLPIRGYGVMLAMGVASGLGLAYLQRERVGISLDQILSLALWLTLIGIAGARTFYVIQKWNEMGPLSGTEKLIEAFKFTEGGLVVYGGAIGGLIAIAAWCSLKRVSLLGVADIVVPGFMIGLAFGRIGCLLNGCCYGGICEAPLPAITFPTGSPPYIDQLDSGRLIGLRLEESNNGNEKNRYPRKISSITSGSWAEKNGLRSGQVIEGIRFNLYPPPIDDDPAGPPVVAASIEPKGQPPQFIDLPERSLPVHPSQIYASINGLLLAGFLFCLLSLTRIEGVVLSTGLVLYGISRILEEAIRSDEGGQFGTALTISQWISLIGIAVGIAIFGMCLAKRGDRPILSV